MTQLSLRTVEKSMRSIVVQVAKASSFSGPLARWSEELIGTFLHLLQEKVHSAVIGMFSQNFVSSSCRDGAPRLLVTQVLGHQINYLTFVTISDKVDALLEADSCQLAWHTANKKGSRGHRLKGTHIGILRKVVSRHIHDDL